MITKINIFTNKDKTEAYLNIDRPGPGDELPSVKDIFGLL